MFLNWGLGLLEVYKIIRQFESELMQTHERGETDGRAMSQILIWHGRPFAVEKVTVLSSLAMLFQGVADGGIGGFLQFRGIFPSGFDGDTDDQFDL